MNTQEISIENHILEGDISLSKELAHQMQKRYNYGKIAVAAENPLGVMSSVRKQWLRLIRRMEREKASTLDHRRQHELEQAIWQMQNIRFTAQDPSHDPVEYVSFATVEQFRLFPPACTTLS